jgi:hypothetical protein
MIYINYDFSGAIRVFASQTDKGRIVCDNASIAIGYPDSTKGEEILKERNNFLQKYAFAFYLKQGDTLFNALIADSQTVVTFEGAQPAFIDVYRFVAMLFPSAIRIRVSKKGELIWQSSIPVNGSGNNTLEESILSSDSPSRATPEDTEKG